MTTKTAILNFIESCEEEINAPDIAAELSIPLSRVIQILKGLDIKGFIIKRGCGYVLNETKK